MSSTASSGPRPTPSRSLYPEGLVEVPMSPISDIGAFRTGRWRLDWFLEAVRLGVEWAIEHRGAYEFLGHPSCLYVADPDFRAIDLICDLVRKAGDRAALVGLDALARRARLREDKTERPPAGAVGSTSAASPTEGRPDDSEGFLGSLRSPESLPTTNGFNVLEVFAWKARVSRSQNAYNNVKLRRRTMGVARQSGTLESLPRRHDSAPLASKCFVFLVMTCSP